MSIKWAISECSIVVAVSMQWIYYQWIQWFKYLFLCVCVFQTSRHNIDGDYVSAQFCSTCTLFCSIMTLLCCLILPATAILSLIIVLSPQWSAVAVDCMLYMIKTLIDWARFKLYIIAKIPVVSIVCVVNFWYRKSQ